MPPEETHEYLLDTHVWIWFMEGRHEELSRRSWRKLERGSEAGRLLVSVISVWEVAMLVARGRLRLRLAIDDWVRRGLAAPGIRIAELTPEIALDSTRLPESRHSDPADCLLIATARHNAARLVTRDARIIEYAASGHLMAADASP